MSSDERVTCNVTEAIESHAQGEQNSKAAEIEKVGDSGENSCVYACLFACTRVYVRLCVWACVRVIVCV